MTTGYIATCTPSARSNVRIRITPDDNRTTNVIGLLPPGVRLPVVVVGDTWLRVEYRGEERYVRGDVVRLEMG